MYVHFFKKKYIYVCVCVCVVCVCVCVYIYIYIYIYISAKHFTKSQKFKYNELLYYFHCNYISN
jgi:hypothetical protein